MIKLTATLFGSALLLTACSTQVMKECLQPLIGQPIRAANRRLGIPDDERVIAGYKIYTWKTTRVTKGTASSCEIRAIMTGDVVANFEFGGNEFVCADYANRLR